MKTLTEWLENDAKDCGLCDPPMKADLAIQFLKDYLLGENWYVTMPENAYAEYTSSANMYGINFQYKF